MALGGGTFTAQNKPLPGAYINFVSVAAASPSLSDRGIVTMPLELDWGREGEVFAVTNEDFQKDSMRIFGYAYTDGRMKGLRDLFIHAVTLYAYRLNGGGEKASNDFAVAKYSGVRGNDLKIGIQSNVDDPAKWDVTTYLGASKVDTQTVREGSELAANDYVTFKEALELATVAAAPLSGGTNGEVSGESYQAYADKIESFTFNTMGIVTTDDTVKKLFISFNRRLRDEMGIKFQLVVYQYAKADYMGVVSVKNKCLDGAYQSEGGNVVYPDEAAAVYWATGAEAGCKVNASCQNAAYDGEYEIDTAYTQTELVHAIQNGEFVFHSVNSLVRVLDDINTMVTTSDEQGDVFKDNQTVRVLDQIGNDIAVLFNTKYLGAVPNDKAGRTSLWSDIVTHHRELEKIRAIEGFEASDVTVEQGSTRKSVVVGDAVTVVNAMSKLYMTVTVE